MTTQTHLAGVVLIFLAAAGVTIFATPASGGIESYEALRASAPDGRSIAVENLVLERDVFQIRFAAGRIHLFAPVDGKTHGAVFVGTGEFELIPATEGERRHVAFLINRPELQSFSDTFDELVLLFDDGTADELRSAGTLQEGQPDAAALKAYERHMKWQRKDLRENYHLKVAQSMLNDHGLADRPFFAFARGGKNRRVLIALDPMGVLHPEEVGLMVYDHDDRDTHVYSDHWTHELQGGTTEGCRTKLVVDALHYELDTRVVDKVDIDATATIRLRVTAPEVRVVPFDLLHALRIDEAWRIPDQDGAEPTRVAFVQGAVKEDADPALIFDEPLERGEEITVRIHYASVKVRIAEAGVVRGVIEDDGDGNYLVMARTHWYPNFGRAYDASTFDLTYRLPEGNQVMSVGHHVRTGQAEGETVSIWKAEEPIEYAGFNYGKLNCQEQREESSGMLLRVCTNEGTPDIIEEINQYLRAGNSSGSTRDAVAQATTDTAYNLPTQTGSSNINVSTDLLAESSMADATNSVRVFSTMFGEAPLREITISQQSQWFFGQSFPTLIFMPYLAALDGTARSTLGIQSDDLALFIDQVGIHEVAHQWWGNSVQPESYRDAWLSEGFAEFSTGLVVELTQGPEAADDFWRKRREDILEKSFGGGVKNFEAGPIDLGFRLSTERSEGAYQALVYSKGGFVLHMLRMLMRDTDAEQPDGAFFAMMKEFATTYHGKHASTGDFKAMVEKHMTPKINATGDGKIDWFFDQWVHGSEVPRYDVEVKVVKAGKGKYRLLGKIGQSEVSDDFMAIVPIYIDLGKGKLGKFGNAPFKGTMSHDIDVTLDLPRKPKGVVANAHYEILAN